MTMKWYGDQISAGMKKEFIQRLTRACLLVEEVTKRSMRQGGRTESGYKREGEKPSRTGTFTSKPGEVPRVQTGALRESITYDVDKLKLEGRVGAGMEYAKYLEFGTDKMSPRPFLRPAFHRSERPIQAIFRRPIHRLQGVPR